MSNIKKDNEYVSCDAPPLDFSFKKIKNLQEIKTIQPRQGTRLNPVDEDGKPIAKVQSKEAEKQENDEASKGQNQQKDKKKNQITKLLPENNINNIVNTLVSTSAMKNISMKAKQQLQKQKKKSIHVKLVCLSLMLSYNKIRQLKNFDSVISFVMPDHRNLQWVDLSHNYLTRLDYNFADYPNLRTLYLHCNFLYDINDFEQLGKHEQLKTLMVHGNPLATVPNFRCYLISLLPNLKKIDSVLVSKKQVDNANFLRSQVKRLPLANNPAKPPVEKAEQEDEDKQTV